ncbi:uncharacterized protein [Miscanthus floridulus]|uniref:uncharacterized protein isoform X4 n=1 Tax=Miscanthus floridulus TaxID=154761 RepID=UPI00345A5C9B
MPPPGPRLPPLLLLLLLAAACSSGLTGAGEGGSCEFSVERGGELYSFALEAPTPAHRHGVLSEDGFYKVAVNDSILWFQLCDEMLFNFDPPMCLNCEDCGGPSRCGTQCSALVSNYIRGYDVCTTIGSLSKSHISLVDESNPQKGIIVKMFSSKCSISVSVLCESTAAQVPDKFVVSGLCDYVCFCFWKWLGMVKHFVHDNSVPSWRVHFDWSSLQILFPWHSFCRGHSKPGILDWSAPTH